MQLGICVVHDVHLLLQSMVLLEDFLGLIYSQSVSFPLFGDGTVLHTMPRHLAFGNCFSIADCVEVGCFVTPG